MKIYDDMITGRNDLLRDPRKYKTDLGSNRANIKDLREFKELGLISQQNIQSKFYSCVEFAIFCR